MSRAVKMTELLIPCYKYLTSLLFLLDLKIVKKRGTSLPPGDAKLIWDV